MLKPFKPFLPFIIAIGLFVILDCLILYTPVRDLLDTQLDNCLERKLIQVKADRPQQLDLLFLGSSRTNNGFVTEIFEKSWPTQAINAYNMGLPAGDYFLFKLALNNHIQQYGKPKLILLEVTDFFFNPDFISNNNILYIRVLMAQNPAMVSAIFKSPELSLELKKEIFFASVSGLYRYRSLFTPNKFKKMLLNRESFKARKFFQGWNPKEIKKVMASDHTVRENALARKRTLLDNFTRFDSSKLVSFLTYCQNENIPVVLVDWPSHPYYADLFEQHPISSTYHQEIAHIAKQFDIPFLNLSAQITPNIAGLYADAGHLSPAGAKQYTQLLTQKLVELDKTHAFFKPKAQPLALLKSAKAH